MGNVMAYSGITTKVRAMSAKLLKEKDYDTIAGLGTVTEAIEYLKDKTAYAPYVERMDVSLYHRGNVEKILYQSLFDDYSRIFRFAGMEQKTFLKLYWFQDVGADTDHHLIPLSPLLFVRRFHPYGS